MNHLSLNASEKLIQFMIQNIREGSYVQLCGIVYIDLEPIYKLTQVMVLRLNVYNSVLSLDNQTEKKLETIHLHPDATNLLQDISESVIEADNKLIDQFFKKLNLIYL